MGVQAPTDKGKGSAVNGKPNLSSYKNTKNPRDTSAADDIYKMLAEKDPEVAKTFAANLRGE